jgi:hypothetical protein
MQFTYSYDTTAPDGTTPVTANLVLTTLDTPNADGGYTVTNVTGTWHGQTVTGLSTYANADQLFYPADNSPAAGTVGYESSAGLSFSVDTTGAGAIPGDDGGGNVNISTTTPNGGTAGDYEYDDVNGSTQLLTAETVTCFAAGTRISTPDGEVRVEDLAVGDLVLTLDGRAQPIRWIGQRVVDCRRHTAPAAIMPVRIEAHAFGFGQPARDLLVSPDHAIFSEGVFIPVKHLINGDTIRQIDTASVTYFHVELPQHNVILSEGLPSESYLDTGDRSSFAAPDGVISLQPMFGGGRSDVTLAWEALGFAPLRVTGDEVARVRARLAATAETTARAAVG